MADDRLDSKEPVGISFESNQASVEKEAADPPEETDATEDNTLWTTSAAAPGSSINTQSIMKIEEDKLKAKYPTAKSGKSEFLKNRLAKKKVFFDSGEYNVAKAKERSTAKKISSTPVTLPKDTIEGSSSGGSDHDSETEADHVPRVLNAPKEQPMPTPEDLIIRRASLHMPKNKPVPEQLLFRRATVQAARMLSTGEEVNPLEILGDLPVLSPEHVSQKRPSLPSKLTMG